MISALQSVSLIIAAIVFACMVHEYGHLTAALLQGVPVKRLGWRTFHGSYVLRERAPRLGVEILISIAGPAANIVAAALMYPVVWFWSFNLVLALSNLLPILPGSDGARVLRYVKTYWQTRQRLMEVCRANVDPVLISEGQFTDAERC